VTFKQKSNASYHRVHSVVQFEIPTEASCTHESKRLNHDAVVTGRSRNDKRPLDSKVAF
jgi:hypothetical protein